MAPPSYQASPPHAGSATSSTTTTAPDGARAPAGGPCPFCHIAATYPPYDPCRPPAASSPAVAPDRAAPGPPAHLLLSTPLLVAFLDIMPLSRGHLLVCPRRHAPRLTDAGPGEAAALGRALRVLSEAVARATGVRDWNVVQNNGAAAAQVVPHVHFHVIPRPEIRAQGRWSERFTMFGRGQREDLDGDEAGPLAEGIRAAVAEVLAEEDDDDDGGAKAKL